jgi:hypothetical protein
MNRYREIELGVEGIEYIKEILQEGGALASVLLPTVAFNSGKAKTYLPIHVTTKVAKDFKSGGKTKADDEWIVSSITDHLKKKKDQVVLFEHGLAKPKDDWIKKNKSLFVFCDDTVIATVSGQDSKEKVQQALLATRTAFPSQIIAIAQRNENIILGSTILVTKLIEIAQTTEIIFVEAYDGEGFVIWQKLNSP